MSRLLTLSTLGALLVLSAVPGAGEGGAEPAGVSGTGSAMFCTTYTTGTDTHTACAPPAPAPLGPAVACHDYTVGADTHAECAPLPAPRLSAPSGRQPLAPPPPAFAPRCSTYHIGSSVYTDCR